MRTWFTNVEYLNRNNQMVDPVILERAFWGYIRLLSKKYDKIALTPRSSFVTVAVEGEATEILLYTKFLRGQLDTRLLVFEEEGFTRKVHIP